ncbi:MAG: retropepsin-like aspartic protease [Pseudomonadota bacterium]
MTIRAKKGRALTPWFVSLIGLLALTGCVAVPSAERADRPIAVTAFYSTPEGVPLVDVSLNGAGPYPLVIDTAASRTLITKKVAAELSLTLSEGRTARVFSLNSVERHRTATVSSLAIGAATNRDVSIIVVDEFTAASGAKGVLGVDILARYGLFMDPVSKALSLYQPNVRPDIVNDEWRETLLYPTTFGVGSGRLYSLNANVAGRPFDALLDTGAEVTVGNIALVDYLTMRRIRRTNQATRIKGADGPAAQAYAVDYRDFRSGRINWGRGVFFASEARIFEELGYRNRPFALIGFDVLGRRPFAIDFQGGVLRVGPTSKTDPLGDSPDASSAVSSAASAP